MPKFEFESDFRLRETLTALGMPDAFLWEVADFSGMTGNRDLFIEDVIHKAFVSVDEAGTEAAADSGFATVACVLLKTLEHKFITSNGAR
ncbi:hypothetical protein ES703_67931 [subsurface metagenome]